MCRVQRSKQQLYNGKKGVFEMEDLEAVYELGNHGQYLQGKESLICDWLLCI